MDAGKAMAILESLRNSVDESALIVAAFGALFSIASALYLTSRKISAEFKYRRTELSNLYSTNLLQKRLETYPDMWFYLSDYAKIMERFLDADGQSRVATIENLCEFSNNISIWDSKNGHLISANSAASSYALRDKIREIILNRQSQGDRGHITRNEYLSISEYLTRLEVSLRTDLGIYEVEKLEGRRVLRGYEDVSRTVGMKWPIGG